MILVSKTARGSLARVATSKFWQHPTRGILTERSRYNIKLTYNLNGVTNPVNCRGRLRLSHKCLPSLVHLRPTRNSSQLLLLLFESKHLLTCGIWGTAASIQFWGCCGENSNTYAASTWICTSCRCVSYIWDILTSNTSSNWTCSKIFWRNKSYGARSWGKNKSASKKKWIDAQERMKKLSGGTTSTTTADEWLIMCV